MHRDLVGATLQAAFEDVANTQLPPDVADPHRLALVGEGRFVEGADRGQATLFPERLDDAIRANNPVRVVDAFIDALDLAALGFDVVPAATGRPGSQSDPVIA